MRWKKFDFAIVLITCALIHAGLVYSQSAGGSEKIEPKVLSDMRQARTASFFVVLGEQADLSHAATIADWKGRGEAVVKSLRETAVRTQAPILDVLANFNVEVTPFWIVNTIKVTTSDERVIHRLASLPNVASIKAERIWQIPEPTIGAEEPTIQSIEWGVSRVHAPDVWTQFGARGQGIVVASIDTGVQFDHPALVMQYRGRKSDGTFDHNYNWYDPSRVCGNPSLAPCDNNGHGTHTMGTAVGGDGGANQIGVAPGARWITAKGCEGSSCSSSALLFSGQWILAPTDLNGQNPRPDLRPNIVNNSWGGDSGTDPFYRTIIQDWVNAGIFPAFAIGNSGPACNSAEAPGVFPETFGVGAVDIFDNIASFSGRGPANGFGGIVKPNISAPGVSVRSSVPTNGYASFSGTSMATPHAAGVVALLWSANPALIGNIAATEDLLQRTADFRSSTQCGTAGPPNNVYGWGIVNALTAVQSAVPTHTLTIASSNPTSGVPITVTPNDINGQSNGSTQFTRTYSNNAAVTLIAPSLAGGNNFSNWTGCDSSFGTTCNVTMSVDKTVTAVYVTPTRTLTVASSNPSSGASITVSPNDNSNQGNGTTQFTRMYNNNGAVTLTAASIAGGNNFSNWTGCDSSFGTACNVTMSTDKTVTAVYLAPTWPAAPTNLAAQCSADNTQATLSWSTVNGATAYALRVNYRANDGPGCAIDGWYCSDPPDKIVNNYGGTSYVANVTPGQPYDFWVHGLQASSYGNAGTASFTCGQQSAFDYALNNSGNITVTQGTSGSNTITRTLLSGNSQGVTLSASNLPSGASASFTNNPCNPTCSSTLTISTSASTPTGTFPITVTGSPLGRTTSFNLVINLGSGTPTWPSAPSNLVAQCSSDNTQATLSWSSVNGATAYALRVNYQANDGPGCIDGWYCSDPPDKIVNNYGGTSYVASVTPGQTYTFWVHGVQGSNYGNAGSVSFTCGTPTLLPTWPSAPINLAAQCSPDNTQATLSWSSVNGATAYALRVNYQANDGPGCIDGWYCSDPPDKIVNNYGGTSYVANITPGQPYNFWVHGLQAGNYSNAGTASFTCSAPPV